MDMTWASKEQLDKNTLQFNAKLPSSIPRILQWSNGKTWPWEMSGVFKIPPCWIIANASLCGKTDEKFHKEGLQWDKQENDHF